MTADMLFYNPQATTPTLKHNCTQQIMQQTSCFPRWFLIAFSFTAQNLLEGVYSFRLFEKSSSGHFCSRRRQLCTYPGQGLLTAISHLFFLNLGIQPTVFSRNLYELRQSYPINKSDSIILYQNNILAFNECNCQYRVMHYESLFSPS